MDDDLVVLPEGVDFLLLGVTGFGHEVFLAEVGFDVFEGGELGFVEFEDADVVGADVGFEGAVPGAGIGGELHNFVGEIGTEAAEEGGAGGAGDMVGGEDFLSEGDGVVALGEFMAE